MMITNPFRKSNPTSNPFDPTSVLSSSSASSEPPAPTVPSIQVSSSPPLPRLPSPGPPSSPPRQRFQPPPGPPPNQTAPSPQSTGSGGGGGGQLEADDLNAEAPPAYTPSADVYQGESVLEVGPRRPFQRVPQQPLPPPPPQPQPQQHYAPPQGPPQQPYLAPQGNEWDQYQRHTGQRSQSNPALVPPQSGGGWSSYPSQQRPYSSSDNPAYITPNPNLPPAPPRHPRSQTSLASQPSKQAPVSDFARDFYAAGGGDGSEDAAASTSNSTPNANGFAPPPGPPPSTSLSLSPSSSSNQYAPPPGAPPPARPKSSSAVTRPNANSDVGPSARTGPDEIPDDGRPMSVPTPGHPLLLNNRMLVYPSGFECNKCNNTGFKNNDPTHPCRKCWERYSRPYAGALAYTPWSNSANASSSSPGSSSSATASHSKLNFQKPLPNFRPPQLSRVGTSQMQTHNRSVSTPSLSRAQTQGSYQPQHHHQQQQQPPPPQQHPTPRIHLASPYAPINQAPPGSTVVQPGDPRIGGRLCHKCLGKGMVPFLIFEEITCGVCGGVGRLF